MAAYNPHDTLTVEFRAVERVIGAQHARRLFDVIRLERSLRRMRVLADETAQDEHSASVGALLEHLREFMEAAHALGRVSNVVDTLALGVELGLDAECVACALTAGGLCPDHAAASG